MMRSPIAARALGAVLLERERQDKRWGEQNHSPEKWVVILQEEVGEFCREGLEGREEGMYREAVQVAAVALAMVECLERKRERK